jgi:isoleucyl-tRNA synthetase
LAETIGVMRKARNLVVLFSENDVLMTPSIRLNKKTAAAKLGPKLKEAEAELANLDATQIGAGIKLAGVDLEPSDLICEYVAPIGYSGIVDKEAQIVLDARITPELKAEGLARDVVRFVQDARKDAGLDVADKIALFLGTESDELRRAIDTHWSTIAAEVQAVERLAAPQAGGHTAEVKLDGQPLRIGLHKV